MSFTKSSVSLDLSDGKVHRSISYPRNCRIHGRLLKLSA